MIYTASFDFAKTHPRVLSGELKMWSIAYKHPAGWNERNICPNFMPWQFMEDQLRRKEMIETGYEIRYRECVLTNANPNFLYEYYAGILCCYEPYGQWCHRHIVSKWFNERGFKVQELGQEPEPPKPVEQPKPEPVVEPVKKMKTMSLFDF